MQKNHRKHDNREIERMEKSKFGMYRGPINVGESKSTGKVDIVNLHSNTSVSSNGVGIIAAEITFNPNSTLQWASFAARYREYRVLAVQAKWVPYHVNNTTALVVGPMMIGQNKGAAIGTPTTIAQIQALALSKAKHTARGFSYTVRPDDYTDLDVGSTASPSSEFSILIYGDGLSNSTTYGKFLYTWVVQFSSTQ